MNIFHGSQRLHMQTQKPTQRSQIILTDITDFDSLPLVEKEALANKHTKKVSPCFKTKGGGRICSIHARTKMQKSNEGDFDYGRCTFKLHSCPHPVSSVLSHSPSTPLSTIFILLNPFIVIIIQSNLCPPATLPIDRP